MDGRQAKKSSCFVRGVVGGPLAIFLTGSLFFLRRRDCEEESESVRVGEETRKRTVEDEKADGSCRSWLIDFRAVTSGLVSTCSTHWADRDGRWQRRHDVLRAVKARRERVVCVTSPELIT